MDGSLHRGRTGRGGQGRNAVRQRTSVSRVRENRMHGSKGMGWKRTQATVCGGEHRRETAVTGATTYCSYRASAHLWSPHSLRSGCYLAGYPCRTACYQGLDADLRAGR